MSADVVLDKGRTRFVTVRDGHEGRLEVTFDDGRLVLDHTEVAEELGGQGVGGELVQAALAHARAEGLTVVPECEFAAKWMRRRSEAVDGVSVDWPPDNG